MEEVAMERHSLRARTSHQKLKRFLLLPRAWRFLSYQLCLHDGRWKDSELADEAVELPYANTSERDGSFCMGINWATRW